MTLTTTSSTTPLPLSIGPTILLGELGRGSGNTMHNRTKITMRRLTTSLTNGHPGPLLELGDRFGSITMLRRLMTSLTNGFHGPLQGPGHQSGSITRKRRSDYPMIVSCHRPYLMQTIGCIGSSDIKLWVTIGVTSYKPWLVLAWWSFLGSADSLYYVALAQNRLCTGGNSGQLLNDLGAIKRPSASGTPEWSHCAAWKRPTGAYNPPFHLSSQMPGSFGRHRWRSSACDEKQHPAGSSLRWQSPVVGSCVQASRSARADTFGYGRWNVWIPRSQRTARSWGVIGAWLVVYFQYEPTSWQKVGVFLGFGSVGYDCGKFEPTLDSQVFGPSLHRWTRIAPWW